MFLGPYEILGTIGRGGMAVVLHARAEDGREVALKVIQKSNSRELLDRFDRERRLLEALGEEEGFVPLLGSGDSPQGPFLVMPFIAGGTLRKRLEAGPLDVEDTIEIARTLAGALKRAHVAGIVHRDLKPENVLFTSGGRPLIADLGLAKHFEGVDGGGSTARSLTLSKGGELRGTAGYMPVEQMRDAKTVGP
ncbi:MAG: serine/threonine-protein kinase, partial [Planctomycetota bacterium]